MSFTAVARRTRTAAAVAVALAVGVAPAAASAADRAPATGAKIERIAKGGASKRTPSKQSLKSVKRELKRAGLNSTESHSGSKKMRRGGCLITYYYGFAIAECVNGSFVDVWADIYGDGLGWLYYGWY